MRNLTCFLLMTVTVVAEEHSADLVVYGGTSAGIAATVEWCLGCDEISVHIKTTEWGIN